MIRYVITEFVIALALGASTSLLAAPPIGAVVQTWNYDPKTNSVTLNTSQKDITAFNIVIKSACNPFFKTSRPSLGSANSVDSFSDYFL